MSGQSYLGFVFLISDIWTPESGARYDMGNGTQSAISLSTTQLEGFYPDGPVPDPSSTLLLFGMGLVGLRAWRKRWQ
jgi:hypothetical protein